MYRPKYRCFCPFYENEYIKGVCCSGAAGATRTTLEFGSEEEKYEFIKLHCVNEQPDNCPYFQLLAMQFAED